MSFQSAPIQITGASYQLRSKPLSSQQTVNWYQQYNEQTTEKYTLHSFPALKQVGDFDTESINRGFHRMAEVLYQVKGNTLYSINSSGEHTELGEIPNYDRCSIANDGINMFIVTGGSVYKYSSTLKTIEKVLTNYNGLKTVTYFRGVFVYGGVKFAYVSTAGDGSTIQGAIGADLNPDGLTSVYADKETLWMMGARTCESFYFSGTGTPPLAKLAGQVFNVGAKSPHSIVSTDEYFYFLGDDYSIYRARGGATEKISTDAISTYIQDSLRA